MDVFEKCYHFDLWKVLPNLGFDPYFKTIEEKLGTEIVVDGRRMIMIGSNDYLGLSTDPQVKEAAIEATRKFGSSSSGSRFLNGTLVLHKELEQRLAAFLGKESAIVYSTGFQSNQGALAPLLGKGDIVYLDKDNHASIVEGVRLSMAEMKRYRHGDMAHLERLLANSPKDAGKLIVVDGVFSMEGDVVDLPAIVDLKKRYNARLMVDDAHGMGVLGEGGRGTSEHFGLDQEVDLVMGTFSKSFGSLGGVIAGEQPVIEFIRRNSRALLFSASMTPGAVGACLKSLDIIQNEPERRKRLLQIASKMREGFTAIGFHVGGGETPVVPIIIGDDEKTFLFWRMLWDAGIFTNSVVSPAVGPGMQLIRTSYMATHTDEQLDHVLEVFETVGRKLGIIGS